MPGNYTASARFAGIALEAKHFDDALSASERGLLHASGPYERTVLLMTKAQALIGKGEADRARSVLEEALQSARAIANQRTRAGYVRRINQLIAELGAAER
jgi:ATP/maltotriose-dependent transcriptional regulator MalT